jgi:glycosyltransferase involved in cell wall biosynthesis
MWTPTRRATVARYLRQQAAERNFQLIRRERYLSPNQARNVGLAAVTSDYVVFIDNDCEVAPGCLAALLRCAEETGAWAVAPVYFERGSTRRVHMAGASGGIVEQNGVRDCKYAHLHLDCPVDELVPSLRRAETDLFEFHCVLLRRSALDLLGPLDEQLLSALEHEDLALSIRAAGRDDLPRAGSPGDLRPRRQDRPRGRCICAAALERGLEPSQHRPLPHEVDLEARLGRGHGRLVQ